MEKDIAQFLEDTINWMLPGCTFYYRDTNSNIDIRALYPVGAIIRAGFFIDVTSKAQRPVTNTRFIIASAHCANIYESVSDDDIMRWRLCTLHFNSYFKVMDIYERDGITQVFLLHFPYKAIPIFRNQQSFNFIQGFAHTDFVKMARQSLDTKLEMDVLPDTTESELLERMENLIGTDEDGNLMPLDFAKTPERIKSLSDAIRTLADDNDLINYPEE
jgi:hypothetical protein